MDQTKRIDLHKNRFRRQNFLIHNSKIKLKYYTKIVKI
jgi:hypothetical protein